MTGDLERDPDRSPPARPVRVARFDGFPAVDRDPAQESPPQELPSQEPLSQGSAVPDGVDRNDPSIAVAAFDGLPGADGSPTAAATSTVADLDGLDGRDRPATAVAGFDGLGAAPPAAASVARLDALDRRTGDRPTDRRATTRRDRHDGTDRQQSPGIEPARRGSRRRLPAVADRTPPADDRTEGDRTEGDRTEGDRTEGDRTEGDRTENARTENDRTENDRSGDDGLPPDRPLPRGRRRGARAGRLGPDAPDPDGAAAESEPADPVAVAREICLRLLTDRARTRQELAQALARKGVPDAAAATVLDRFDEVGLIDDVAFAGQWVRSRHVHRGLGRRAIAVELRRKGVADDVAGEALAEVDAESEERRARELVDRKLRSIAVDTTEQRASAARRLVGMLARKGYGAGTAYRVVREALAARGAEVDELGDGHDG